MEKAAVLYVTMIKRKQKKRKKEITNHKATSNK